MGRYREGRTYRMLTTLSVVAVLAISSVVIYGLWNKDLLQIEETDERDIHLEGMYLVIEDTITVRNSFNSSIDDLGLVLSLKDTRYDRMLELWKDDGLEIPSRDNIVIPINIRVSAFSFAAAVIDSLSVENSALKLHVDTTARYIFGIFDADIGFDLVVPLADDGKTVTYGITTNTQNKLVLEIHDLSEKFAPPDISIIMTTTDSELDLRVESTGGDISVVLESSDKLDTVVSNMKTQEVTITGLPEGSEVSKDDILNVVSALLYLRQIL